MREIDEARVGLCARLTARRSEIERTIVARIAGSARHERAGEVFVVHDAVAAGVAHGLAGVRHGEGGVGPIPEALLAQAHRSARGGVGLDAVLRDYFTGYALFCDFILQGVEEEAAPCAVDPRGIMRVEAALFERVLVAVTGEFARERRGRPRPSGVRQLECVRSLLAGERIDPACLAYEIDAWHLAAIVLGSGGPSLVRDLARAGDCRLLLVRPEPDVAWVWFGGRRRSRIDDLIDRLPPSGRGILIALGEPARGQDGWRLSHRQAKAAMRVTRPGAEGAVRYADVGLLASISQDRVLVTSLHEIYIAPLADAHDGGAALRATLRAYFAASRNVSSAASALGVSRQTVGSRLRLAEEKLGRTLGACGPELEMALELERIGALGETSDAGVRPP